MKRTNSNLSGAIIKPKGCRMNSTKLKSTKPKGCQMNRTKLISVCCNIKPMGCRMNGTKLKSVCCYIKLECIFSLTFVTVLDMTIYK